MVAQPTTVLQGIDDITTYAQRPWNTIKKWIEEKNFPARMIDGRWESDTELITRWRRRQIEEA